MHGQITHETRTIYRSRCFCGWVSEESEHEDITDLAYDEHVSELRRDAPASVPGDPLPLDVCRCVEESDCPHDWRALTEGRS